MYEYFKGSTIVAAVREGRGIFDNIRKFLRYLLSSSQNVMVLSSLAPALEPQAPMPNMVATARVAAAMVQLRMRKISP